MPEDEISRGNSRAASEAHVLQYLLSSKSTYGDTSLVGPCENFASTKIQRNTLSELCGNLKLNHPAKNCASSICY